MSAARRSSSSSTSTKPAPPADCKENCKSWAGSDCRLCRTSDDGSGGGACPAVKQEKRCIAMCGSLKSQCGRQHDVPREDPVLLNRMCWQHQMAMMGQFDTDQFDPDSGIGVEEGQRVAALLPQMLAPTSPIASAILDNALVAVMQYARQPEVWETLHGVRAAKLKVADTNRRREARSVVKAEIAREEDQATRDHAIQTITNQVCRYMQQRGFDERQPPHLWVRAFMMSVRTRLAAQRSKMRDPDDRSVVDDVLSNINDASFVNRDNTEKIMSQLEKSIVDEHEQCLRRSQQQ